MGLTVRKDTATLRHGRQGPGRRSLVAGAVGAALATAASTASVGALASSASPHTRPGPLTVAWSGAPLGLGGPSDPRLRPPPPPSWIGGVLPSARHGRSVGEQLRSKHPDRRARAAADVFGAAALHGDLPASMQGAVVGIPTIVLGAYRSAAAAMHQQDPRCGVPWWLLAGIGRIESGHASDGRVDAAGTTRGTILGPRLDGSMPGTSVISDSDRGRLDGDPDYDRAVGPMQFLPSTWAGVASDGNGDGVASPNNVYDASLGAARYLCAGGGDLRTLPGLTAAVLRYNASMSYVRSVLTWGTAYRDKVRPTPAAPGRVPGGDPRLPAVTPEPKPRQEPAGRGPGVLAGGPAAQRQSGPGGGGQSGGSGSSGQGGAGDSSQDEPGPSPTPTQSPSTSRAGGPPTSASSSTSTNPPPSPSGGGQGTPAPAPTSPVPSPTPTGSMPPPNPTTPPPTTPAPSGSSSSGTTTPPPGGSTTPTPTDSSTPADGTVNGWVWADTDPTNVGIQAPGEPGMPSIGIHLLRLVDGVETDVAKGSTDDTGSFSLDAPPGDYTLLVELPVGAAFTAQDAGDDDFDSDVDAAGRVEVTLTPDGHVTMDAGLVWPSLSGTVQTQPTPSPTTTPSQTAEFSATDGTTQDGTTAAGTTTDGTTQDGTTAAGTTTDGTTGDATTAAGPAAGGPPAGPGLVVTATPVDDQGEPRTGAEAPPVVSATTDDQGRYVLRHLLAGTSYALTVLSADGTPVPLLGGQRIVRAAFDEPSVDVTVVGGAPATGTTGTP